MRNLLIVAAVFGFLAVILGAFGAHGLEGKITEKRIGTYETGVTYQFYHTFAIFVSIWLYQLFKNDVFLRAGWFFVAGIVCFSGSLYLLATHQLLGLESLLGILGPITPIGGVLFIIGWAILVFQLIKSNKP